MHVWQSGISGSGIECPNHIVKICHLVQVLHTYVPTLKILAILTARTTLRKPNTLKALGMAETLRISNRMSLQDKNSKKKSNTVKRLLK